MGFWNAYAEGGPAGGGDMAFGAALGNGELTACGPGVLRLELAGRVFAKFSGRSFH